MAWDLFTNFLVITLKKFEEIMKFNSKISITFVHLVLCLAAVLAAVFAVFAQSETATLLGTVRDSNGAVMKGANVTVRNVATTLTASTTTDLNGDYQFVNVKIGLYQITVEIIRL